MRLFAVDVTPDKNDIIHGITSDPNINLDIPMDSAHCVMIHTVQQQLCMSKYFDYVVKRMEYIFYKIIKYVIWSIVNSPDLSYEIRMLVQRREFQSVFELEIFKYTQLLCTNTRKEITSIFDEVMSSPIILAHALRYKEMLINDFGWTEEKI